MNELKSLLLRVPDSYYEFVESLLDEAGKSEARKNALIRYLKDNPEATTSDVIGYLVEDLGLYTDYVIKSRSERAVLIDTACAVGSGT